MTGHELRAVAHAWALAAIELLALIGLTIGNTLAPRSTGALLGGLIPLAAFFLAFAYGAPHTARARIVRADMLAAGACGASLDAYLRWLDSRQRAKPAAPTARRAHARAAHAHPPPRLRRRGRPMRRRRHSLLYTLYLRSPLWRLRRRLWIIQAGGRCQGCGDRRRLTIHHRTYRRLGHEHRADVQVLCWPCHRAVHRRRRRRSVAGAIGWLARAAIVLAAIGLLTHVL